jgi:predicted metal-dependent phosphoesterase TrpH
VIKVDFHIHTSEDPVDHIDHSTYALIDRAASLGYDALAITLHDRQLDEECLRRYASDRGILLVPGVERTIGRKHVLLLNFPAEAARIRTFDELRLLKSRSNGLVVAPHPFFPGGSCLRSLMDVHQDLFDAVEWTYFWTTRVNFNAPACRWAKDRGKPLIANSDLHDIRQLGRTYSLVDAERDPSAICDAIRAGAVTIETEPVPVAELARVFGGMVWRGRRSPAELEQPRDRAPRDIAAAISGVTD